MDISMILMATRRRRYRVKRRYRRVKRRRRHRGGWMGTIARAAFEDQRRAENRKAAYDLKYTPRDPKTYKRELYSDLRRQGISFK